MVPIYTTEQELVDTFLDKLLYGEPWEASKFGIEFNYQRGKPDIIAISSVNEVIAIEAKLIKWRSALHQAYRNRCFADKSYVLLPLEIAEIACRHEYEFERRGVGICSLLDGNITILKEAITEKPIQPWLRQVALQFAMEA